MKQILILTSWVLAMLFSHNTFAQDTKKEKSLKLYADVRFRVEADRNSNKKMKNEKRIDRDRLRYRARFGIKYSINDSYEMGMRLRSGAANNPQSPHVTLGNGFQPAAFSIDKAYIKVKSHGFWVVAGKNSMPFWSQNEMLWDADVNPEGISFGGKLKIGEKTKIIPVLGYYLLDNQNNITQKFIDFGNIYVGQVKLCHKINKDKLSASTGLINASMNFDNKMDYRIWASSLQYKLNGIGLSFGVDYFGNLTDYSSNTAVVNLHKDQKSGYVGSLKYEKEKFMTSFTYAAIQKYAVIDLFAQDDWARWDHTTQSGQTHATLSNFKGFELNFKYKFTSQFNTTLRFWNIKGIKFEDGGNQLQTGTRIRLDLNMKF
jgi:hypothetical protein